jgi:cytochrome P450
MHYNPKYFAKPYEFIPERWDKDAPVELNSHKFAFLTFSQGPRDCLGKTLAMHEAVVVLASLLKNFTFHLDPAYVLKIESGLTNRPLGGLSLEVRRRYRS